MNSQLIRQLELLERKALKGKWVFIDRRDNQLIITKNRYVCALAGLESKDNEFKLIVALRNNAKKLIKIAKKYNALKRKNRKSKR